LRGGKTPTKAPKKASFGEVESFGRKLGERVMKKDKYSSVATRARKAGGKGGPQKREETNVTADRCPPKPESEDKKLTSVGKHRQGNRGTRSPTKP